MMSFILTLFVMYWLPTIIAVVRHAPSALGVAVVNFFLGWTVIGWIMALVWVGIIVGYFLRGYAFHLWVRDVEISTKICLYVALFTAILSWNNIFLYVINGTGKIHLQFILAIITTLIFFPLTHFLVKYLGYGIDGIFISNVAVLLMFSFFMPLQTYFLLKTNRQGIWTR